MPRDIRRVVTGHTADGRSTFVYDGIAANVRIPRDEPEVAMTDLWVTREAPASNAGVADAADYPMALAPPARGTVFRIVELPPDARRSFSNLEHLDGVQARAAGKRHPGFHKTHTVDYIVVLEGEVWALVDTGEVLLRRGDCLVQRGTSHAWSNRSDKPVLLAGVLVDAQPA
ncbi:MAG: cupin domain-containing protein [Burkholderiales bacterium]|nr:cupin domain-containing protein [Burkholderiales bacterium]